MMATSQCHGARPSRCQGAVAALGVAGVVDGSVAIRFDALHFSGYLHARRREVRRGGFGAAPGATAPGMRMETLRREPAA